MFLFDTHCHLDLYADPRAVIAQAEKAQVYVIAVTNTPSVFESTQNFVGKSRFVRPALGLHPELAVERQRELPIFANLLSQTRYIGEIGLDFVTNDMQARQIQQKVFQQILELCQASGDKILTLHSRRAEKEVIHAIGPNFHGKAILHWYSGPLNLIDKAIEHGLYFSINTAMARSKRFSEIIRLIPKNRILTETDGPFVQVGQRVVEPTDVSLVINSLAHLWQIDPAAAAQILFDNFRQLLKPRDI